MKKRILVGVVLIGLIGSLAGAYRIGAQQAAQGCRASTDILITQPNNQPADPLQGDRITSGWHVSQPTVDTVTDPVFNRA